MTADDVYDGSGDWHEIGPGASPAVAGPMPTGDAFMAAYATPELIEGHRNGRAATPPPLDNLERAVSRMLAALGVDGGPHTRNTPVRVARAWRHATRGHGVDPGRHLAVTFPGTPASPLVCQTGIRVVSTCAHHLLPITGMATVAYRPKPGAPIVGLSKLARVVGDYAARITIQEAIGAGVAEILADRLSVDGAACVITAEHGCMSLRGVEQPAARTMTVALAGGWTDTTPDVATVLAEHRAHRG